MSGSPQLLKEVPPPLALYTRNSLHQLKAPEIPPTRRPGARAVSQATTPHSFPPGPRTPTSHGKGRETLAHSLRPHAHPCPPLGSLAASDQGGPAGDALLATRPAATSVSPRTEMARPTKVGGALAPPGYKPRPFPDTVLLRSLRCSDLHLS